MRTHCRSFLFSICAGLVAVVLGHSQSLRAKELNEKDVYKDFGYITLKDGVRLSYVVYRPTREGRYPILLEFSPYGADGLELSGVGTGGAVRGFLEHGYAYAGVDIRGTSCSEGKMSMFDPAIGDDGAQVVEWLGGQPWSTGAVGMIGRSYPGHTQIFTAAKRPKYLKAISPHHLTASAYREVWWPGGMLNVAFISGWALGDRSVAAETRKKWGDTQCDVERARTAFQVTFDEVLKGSVHDDWWKARDLETYAARINVPTLIIQSWQDHQTQVSGATRMYREIETRNKRMILQQGGHGAAVRPISIAETLRWMDRWVKGEDNGVDKDPPITVWWEVHDVNGKLAPNWTTTHANWPVPGVQSDTYYLTADGKLSRERPAASKDNGARRYVYPVGTELVGDNDQFALRPAPGGSLSYRTPPMAEDTTILGYPELTFYLSAEQKDTDVMVTLHDIDEGGNTLYLQRDFLRASKRAINTARSLPDEALRGFDKVEPLVPGQVYEMKLSIPPLGHVLRRGHSLELSIMAPSPIGQPNWGMMILDLPGRNTVYQSAQYPSKLTLPVVPGVRAQAPPPPCGSMEFQPCRMAPKPPMTSSAR